MNDFEWVNNDLIGKYLFLTQLPRRNMGHFNQNIFLERDSSP